MQFIIHFTISTKKQCVYTVVGGSIWRTVKSTPIFWCRQNFLCCYDDTTNDWENCRPLQYFTSAFQWYPTCIGKYTFYQYVLHLVEHWKFYILGLMRFLVCICWLFILWENIWKSIVINQHQQHHHKKTNFYSQLQFSLNFSRWNNLARNSKFHKQ